MKKSNDTIGNQTRDLPTCSAVPQLTALPSAPLRIRNNIETDNLIEGADIGRFIKAQIIKWLGHIQRMEQARPTRKLLDWKHMGTRPVGKTKTTMTRKFHGRSKKPESQKPERGS
jgi:hypothetical protein